MLQFVQIGVQMLDAHLVIGTDDGAFKQAPNALNAIGVNVAYNPLLGGVINPTMLSVLILNSPICGHFVCVDRLCIRRGVIFDELLKTAFVAFGITCSRIIP
jgi:hypothetical protein